MQFIRVLACVERRTSGIVFASSSFIKNRNCVILQTSFVIKTIHHHQRKVTRRIYTYASVLLLPIILHYTAFVSTEPPQKSNLEDEQTETVAPVSIAAVVGPLCIITTGTAAKP